MIEVNWAGNEKEFGTVKAAEKFSRELASKNQGSDIWVNNKLRQTIMLDAKTGEAIMFIYNEKGNNSYKMNR